MAWVSATRRPQAHNALSWAHDDCILALVTALLEVSDLRVALRVAAPAGSPSGVSHHALALRGVSFALHAGRTLGLIGESGCGKSMTALALMGLLPEGAEVSGSIRWREQELLGQTEQAWCALRGQRIGLVFQEPGTALNPLHTIGRQVSEGLRIHGASRAQARSGALAALEAVQLPNAAQRMDAYPHQLSGGQRQRVVLAMALACKPEILLADEPTTALDVTLQREMLALLQARVRGEGLSLLLISHDLALMAEHADTVYVMYAGLVVESGPTAAVFARLAHPYTRGLFGARPRLGGALGQRLATIPGRVPELGHTLPGCSFAPRCPRALAACSATLPELVNVPGLEADHAVRCLNPEPLPT